MSNGNGQSSNTSGAFGGDGIFAPVFDSKVYRRYYSPGNGRAWSFKIRNNDAADFAVYATTYAITTRKD